MPPGGGPKAPAPAPKRPFWADFTDAMSKSSARAGQQLNTSWKSATSGKGGFKMPKWEMPVKVDVDFLNPIIISCKKTANDVWVQLPPPVQAGMPFFAVGAASGLLVYTIEERRLRYQRSRSDRFESRNEKLLVERDELHERVRDLKSRSIAPRSASEMRMAAAVAESTTAAAEAARAAAQAAKSCAFPQRSQNGQMIAGSRARRRYRGSDEDESAYTQEQQQQQQQESEPGITTSDAWTQSHNEAS